MSKKFQRPSPFSKIDILIALSALALVGSLILPRFTNPQNQVQRVPYSLFLQQVEDGEVKAVRLGEKEILYQLKSEEDNPPQVLATTPILDLELPKKLQAKGIEFGAPPPAQQNPLVNALFAWVIPPLIFVLVFQLFMNRNGGGFGKSRAKTYIEGNSTKVTFDDVAGVEEAKTELVEVVEFLKNPDRFAKIGAKIPKGVLLVGPPGTGKTLLARAVAGEAGVSFFSISASEFVEMYVGTGAARVRDLFTQAKKKAPSIIFIDELDAIGKSRQTGANTSGSNDEREQTLNQLLTEMDGFGAGNTTIMILAATNRPEALDRALLRPGRFDRQILVDRPDFAGRLQILEIYGNKVQLDSQVNLKEIATRTPGFAGADLANLVNESALLAARRQRETVQQQDFYEAMERLMAGLEKKSRVLNTKEREIVAYHEVGHAIVGAVLPGGGQVTKISIIPRGIGALGYTLKMPTEDRFLLDEQEWRTQITMLLGGRCAEELIFGTVTNGASDDLRRATDLAEKMVTTYGMSKNLGPLAYNQGNGNGFLSNSPNQRRFISEETAKAIDGEISAIISDCWRRALDILTVNQNLLKEIAEQILQTEVIEGEELAQLLSKAMDNGQLIMDNERNKECRM
ncbi:MAG: ATP-dependent zinc metalloprotease FtsH [Cyanobacterium sp. T60_A2020_053]|nr:ATP-dependent zinc metalloprotease FtsH [Cyanobacterium sp. T60_A2020_053]